MYQKMALMVCICLILKSKIIKKENYYNTMIILFAELIVAKPFPTESVGVDGGPNCNGLKCSLGTEFCTTCCNGQGSKEGKCVPKGAFFVCQCQ